MSVWGNVRFFCQQVWMCCVCISSLNILADLPLQSVPSLLQLFNGAVLRELIRSTSHLTFRHAACEQLLV